MTTRGRNPARVAAQAEGRLFYQGVPCKSGHTERYVLNGTCAVCSRAQGIAAYHGKTERPNAPRFDTAPLVAAISAWHRPIGWITGESLFRLLRGGNESRGTVPIHPKESNAANIPVYAKITSEGKRNDGQ